MSRLVCPRSRSTAVPIPSRTPQIQDFYQSYLNDQDTAEFVRKVAQRYTVGTLERLTGHGRREVRRGAALALGLLADYASNAALGRCLTDEDRIVRTIAENGIRSLWRRPGSEPIRQRLAKLIRYNSTTRYKEAVRAATQLIEDAPQCAEAWNQRAVAYYNLGRFTDSINDCHQALEINPYHFDAATGMGQCYLQLGDPLAALECFKRALRLNPGLEGVRAGAVYLERTLKKKGDLS
jgi:tetratricopeptide (TPR) repeat protein